MMTRSGFINKIYIQPREYTSVYVFDQVPASCGNFAGTKDLAIFIQD